MLTGFGEVRNMDHFIDNSLQRITLGQDPSRFSWKRVSQAISQQVEEEILFERESEYTYK